ncbi:MAG: TetR/AcrR family transcriptional regulator [Anaeroplasmataceae bacterium]
MDRRVLKTKENIKTAVINLILEKNFQEITVKKVSEYANIGRKTFYLHYGCVLDVINEIENEIYSSLNKALEKYINNNELYDIRNIFHDLNSIIEEDILLFKRIAVNDSYSFFKNAFERILSDLIIKITKEFYKVHNPNVYIYSSFYASGIIKLYISWLRGDLKISKNELVKIASRCTFEGALSILKNAS